MSDASTPARSSLFLKRFTQLIRRIPFTLCMVIILSLVAWGTHSFFQELARSWVSRLGFAPRDFWFFRWERLILSALVTSGGWIFWFALTMVALTSGITEWIDGSWRAQLAFWGVHLVSLMLESLIFLFPLHQFGFGQARLIFFSRDVGPSAGYMGSLGYVFTFIPNRWRWLCYAAILIFLIVSFFLPARPGETQAIKLSADMVHIIAFPLGWLVARLFGKKK
jgi:hypothetical protein